MAHRLLLVYLTTAAAICYYPNGNSDDNPLNGRCVSLEGQASACCAINRENPSGGSADASTDGQTADLCMKNGLCKNIKTENQNGRNVTLTSYWRGLCSTPEWPEANCVDVCSSGSTAGSTTQLISCDGTDNSTEWCCGDSDDCCGTSSFTIAPVLAALAASSSSTSTSTSTSTVTAMATSTSTTAKATQPAHTHSSLSTGAMAGIGAGAGVGVVIFGALGYFWMRHRKAATDKNIDMVYERDPRKDMAPVEVEGSNIEPCELNAGVRHELGDR